MSGTRLSATLICSSALAWGWGDLGHAQEKRPPLSPAFRQCVDKGIEYWGSMGNVASACYPVELKVQDAALNRTYAKLRAGVVAKNPAQVQKLVVAEREWIAFRDSWCAFVSEIDTAPAPEVSALWCKARLTAEHIERLKAFDEGVR